MSYEYYEMMAANGGEFLYVRPPVFKTTGKKSRLTNGERRAIQCDKCLYCGKKFYLNQFLRRKVLVDFGGFAHLKCLTPTTRVEFDWF